MKKKNIGSSFDSWLREEDICEEVTGRAIKRVLTRQVAMEESSGQLLEDPRHAPDDGPPLDAETLASLDRGLADIEAGRVKALNDYERKRGL